MKKTNHLSLFLLATLTIVVFSYKLGIRGWYADDYVGVSKVPRLSLFEFIRYWFAHINGRLDCVVQYFIHATFKTPVLAHIFSICIHLLNVYLLYNIISKLFDNQSALVGSLIFAIHQQGCSAVLWTSTFSYLFTTLCMLIAINILTLKSDKKIILYGLAAIIFAIGMASNEQPLILAPLAGILFITKGKHLNFKSYLPAFLFGISSIIAFICQKILSNTGKAQIVTLDNLPAKIITQIKESSFRAISPGFRQTLLPVIKNFKAMPDKYLFFLGIGFIITITFLVITLFTKNNNIDNPEKYSSKHTVIKGMLMFIAAYLIGCFAPHPYLARRMFYVAAVGFSIVIAGIYYLLRKRTQNNLIAKISTGLILLLFSVCSISVILKNVDFYANITKTESTINTELKEGANKYKDKKIYVIGVDRIGGSYGRAEKGFPAKIDENCRILLYENESIKWVGTVKTLLLPQKTTSTIIIDKNINNLLNVTKYIVSTSPIAIIGGRININKIDCTIIDGLEFHIKFIFETNNELNLHKVYPRIILYHKDGTTTKAGFTRAPAHHISRNMYERNIFTVLKNTSKIIKIKIYFEPVATSKDFAKVIAVQKELKLNANSIIIDIDKDY